MQHCTVAADCLRVWLNIFGTILSPSPAVAVMLLVKLTRVLKETATVSITVCPKSRKPDFVILGIFQVKKFYFLLESFCCVFFLFVITATQKCPKCFLTPKNSKMFRRNHHWLIYSPSSSSSSSPSISHSSMPWWCRVVQRFWTPCWDWIALSTLPCSHSDSTTVWLTTCSYRYTHTHTQFSLYPTVLKITVN